MMKFFTSDLRRNLTKILCLTVGLAIGFLLVAKVWFEQTYDAFFPNATTTERRVSSLPSRERVFSTMSYRLRPDNRP